MGVWRRVCKSYPVTVLPLQRSVGVSHVHKKMGKNKVIQHHCHIYMYHYIFSIFIICSSLSVLFRFHCKRFRKSNSSTAQLSVNEKICFMVITEILMAVN